MTARTATTWYCDRCGTQTEIISTGQPDTWSSLMRITPPRATADNSRIHICAECGDAFSKWLEEVS